MEEIQKIIDIKVKYSDAVQGIAQLTSEIDALKVQQMKLNAEVKTGAISQEEYAKEMVATKTAIRSYNDEMRTLQRELDNNIKQERQQEGSLKALRSELSNLTKQYDELSRAERSGIAGNELQNRILAVTKELKSAEEETQRFYRNVGNYGNALKPMRQELKELTMQLAQMERDGLRGSEAYNEMAKRAGQLKDNISDASAEIKRYASDTRALDDVVDMFTTAGTAWQTYQGAMQAFGVESKEAMEAMQKLQGIMAMTNGLQQLHARFTDNSTATYKVFHKVLQLVGLEQKAVAVSEEISTAATTTNTLAVEANTAAETGNIAATQQATAARTAEAAATTASATAMTGASVAAKVLRAALMTIGIGLLVSAIGALVAYWDKVKDFFSGMTAEAKRAAEMQEKLNEAQDEGNKVYAKASAQLNIYITRVKNFNGTQAEEKKLVEELNKEYGDALGKYKTLDEWKAQLTKRGQAMIEVMQLEAQAQAVLNQYIEAFINIDKVRRAAAAGEYDDNWYEFWNWGGKSSEQKRDEAIKAAEQDAEAYFGTYRKIMAEAEQKRSQFNIGGNGGTVSTKKGGGGNTGDSEAERLKREQEEVRKAEDLLTQLIKDNIAKRRAEINAEYDRQIEDIKKSLRERKNVTIKESEALNSQLLSLEKLKAQELKELDDEVTAERIQREQERLQMLLEASQNDILKQRELKLQQLDNEEELRRMEIERSVQDERERQKMLDALQVQYYQKRQDVEAEMEQRAHEEAVERIQRDYEMRVLRTNDELEQLRAELEMRQQMIEEAHQLEGETEEEFLLRMEQLKAQYYETGQKIKEKEIERELAAERARYNAIKGMYQGLTAIMEAFGEDSKTLAMAGKILALGQIAVETGVALAKGIKESQSVPYPGNLVAIATTVGTILANIATAVKTVKSAKFADGGLVQGAGTGTSDSIPARLSNGESVMTAKATSMFSPILSAFNQLGGGVPIVAQSSQQQLGEDMLAAAVAKGFESAPSPVVSVEEINSVGNRVRVIEELSTI